jgi:nucleoid-associated protein YgaU
VGPGESLPDIAERVYGSREATESLWKANRDQIERVDSPLAIGTLLRAP